MCMGPEFAGGDAVTLNFTNKVDVDQLRAALQPDVGQTPIQYEKGAAAETLKIVAPFGKAGAVTNTLAEEFPEAGFNVVATNTVGPSVGEDIKRSAVFASFLSLFGILFYVAFRYEFSFSIGAVLAVVHDVFLTLGIFFLSGRQLSAPMVAAVLTIIGFSLNDKVVIFDRIREDLKLGIARHLPRNHQQGDQPDLEPHHHHFRHGLPFHHVALPVWRRRDQGLCLYLPGRHHHRHLLQHLHRLRPGSVVAQRRASQDRDPGRGGVRRRQRLQTGRLCRARPRLIPETSTQLL